MCSVHSNYIIFDGVLRLTYEIKWNGQHNRTLNLKYFSNLIAQLKFCGYQIKNLLF